MKGSRGLAGDTVLSRLVERETTSPPGGASVSASLLCWHLLNAFLLPSWTSPSFCPSVLDQPSPPLMLPRSC